MVPRTFFSQLGDRAPFVIHTGTVYQFGEGASGEAEARIGESRIGLLPVGELEAIEDFFSDCNGGQIFQLQKTFIEQRLHQEIKDSKNLGDYLKGNSIVHFIVSQIFPYFIEDHGELEAMIQGKEEASSTKKTSLEEVLDQEVSGKMVVAKEIDALREEILAGVKQKKTPAGTTGVHEFNVGDRVEYVGRIQGVTIAQEGSFGIITAVEKRPRPFNGNLYVIEFQRIVADPLLPYTGELPHRFKCNPSLGTLRHYQPHGVTVPMSGRDDAELEALILARSPGVRPRPVGPRVELPIPQKFDGRCGLREILNKESILVMQGMVYTLEASKNDEEGFAISFGRKKFVPKLFTDAENIETAYREHLERQWKYEALDAFQDQVQEITKLRARTKAVEKIAEKNKFEVGSVGFENIHGTYYAYLKIPKFAMCNPLEPDKCHLFPAMRVGVPIFVNQATQQIHSNMPSYVLDGEPHPFTGVTTPGHIRDICMGGYYPPNLTSARNIVEFLTAAVNTITDGYDSAVKPRRYLTDFPSVSKEEAKEKGYMLTNQHHAVSQEDGRKGGNYSGRDFDDDPPF